ncbi:MAG: tyrosine-protein phosphatase [Planctomycetota bacterium]|nr:tyrosine-protein phosphatase [Planctomycetota bacterium]
MRISLRKISFMLFVLLFSLTGSVCSSPSPPPPHFAKRLPGPIDRFALVGEGVYRGGQPDEKGVKELKRLGVRTVIDLRSSERKEYDDLLAKNGIEHIRIPMSDISGEPPTEEQVKKFFEIVSDPSKKPVFFHCRRGVDRTGVFCALYRIEIDGWENSEASKEMQFFGFSPTVYPAFHKFILDYKPHIIKRDASQKGR